MKATLVIQLILEDEVKYVLSREVDSRRLPPVPMVGNLLDIAKGDEDPFEFHIHQTMWDLEEDPEKCGYRLIYQYVVDAEDMLEGTKDYCELYGFEDGGYLPTSETMKVTPFDREARREKAMEEISCD